MADILPSPIPPIIPPLSGPAFSFSQTRKQLDAAADTIDGLATTIKKDIIGNLMPAAREGARIETKALKPIGGKLQAAQQLLDGLSVLVSDDIVGQLAQAVAAVEDYSARKVSAASLGGSSSATPSRATVPADVVSGPSALVRRGANIMQPPPAPAGVLCPIPNRATIIQINKDAQDIADLTSDPLGQDLGACYYSIDDQCCTKATCGSPHDLEAQYPPDWKECMGLVYGIDLGPGCRYVIFQLRGTAKQQQAGFAYIKKQLDPTGIGDKPGSCGTVQVDCKTHPLDPSCPVDCVANPSDPRCPPTDHCPPPCIYVTCPPPVINVPPCPPVDFNFPSCVTIDLCDWEKFCKFLKDCLTQSKEDCGLDNETAYTYLDCDGKYGTAQKLFVGQVGKNVMDIQSTDELLTFLGNYGTPAGPGDFSGPAPY